MRIRLSFSTRTAEKSHFMTNICRGEQQKHPNKIIDFHYNYCSCLLFFKAVAGKLCWDLLYYCIMKTNCRSDPFIQQSSIRLILSCMKILKHDLKPHYSGFYELKAIIKTFWSGVQKCGYYKYILPDVASSLNTFSLENYSLINQSFDLSILSELHFIF